MAKITTTRPMRVSPPACAVAEPHAAHGARLRQWRIVTPASTRARAAATPRRRHRR